MDDEGPLKGGSKMTQAFVYAVVAHDYALIWKDGLEPGSKPMRLVPEEDNPQYRKEHNSRVGDRDKSIMDRHFLEAISSEFAAASHIYLVSSGTGKANSAGQLLEYMQHKHPHLAEKVLATGSADVSALSDNQLLELGRERRVKYMQSNLQLS